jgi:hypothetical protein
MPLPVKLDHLATSPGASISQLETVCPFVATRRAARGEPRKARLPFRRDAARRSWRTQEGETARIVEFGPCHWSRPLSPNGPDTTICIVRR